MRRKLTVSIWKMQSLEKISSKKFKESFWMDVRNYLRDWEKFCLTMHTKRCLFFDYFLFCYLFCIYIFFISLFVVLRLFLDSFLINTQFKESSIISWSKNKFRSIPTFCRFNCFVKLSRVNVFKHVGDDTKVIQPFQPSILDCFKSNSDRSCMLPFTFVVVHVGCVRRIHLTLHSVLMAVQYVNVKSFE